MIAHTATAAQFSPFTSAQVPPTAIAAGQPSSFSAAPLPTSSFEANQRLVQAAYPLHGQPQAPQFREAEPAWPMDYTPASWLEIWSKLVAAELRFKKAVWNDGRCIAVFRRNAPTSRQYGLTPRERTVLVRTLQGERQKLIAAEAKIAASTVANSLKSARVKLGFEDRLDAAPLATLIVANGTENASPYPQRNIYSIGGGEWFMASSPRPDWSGFPEVTKSERSIALAIIEGQSNTEIAKVRDTSVHTVENQVASLFRQVNASGRFDLIRVLYQDTAPNSALMSA
jgi:DNA-binding CsgD family transcriptional regulator